MARQRQGHRRRQHARERVLAVVLGKHHQRVALVEPQAQGLGRRAGRAVQPVTRDGARREHGALTTQVESPSEIDVLEVGEEVLVEASRSDVLLTAHERGRPAREQHAVLGVDPAARTPVVELPRMAECGRRGAGEVHACAVPVEHQRAGGRHAVAFGGFDQFGEPRRLDPRVVVEQRHVVTPALADGQVVGPRESQVGAEFDQPRARMRGAHVVLRAVAGPVVGHDDLDARIVEGIERRQARRQVCPAVAVEHDDRCAGHGSDR